MKSLPACASRPAEMSHPSRVCGLKCRQASSVTTSRCCHTLHGCVVKCVLRVSKIRSHSSRVCGLKSPRRLIDEGEVPVTPFTGVWIEIERRPVRLAPPTVTPFTGVWIEISASAESDDLEVWSHPSRVCGLKLMRSPGRPLVRRHTLHGCGLYPADLPDLSGFCHLHGCVIEITG